MFRKPKSDPSFDRLKAALEDSQRAIDSSAIVIAQLQERLYALATSVAENAVPLSIWEEWRNDWDNTDESRSYPFPNYGGDEDFQESLDFYFNPNNME